MTRITLLTGSELRHEFFRKFIASRPHQSTVLTVCEGQEGNQRAVTEARASGITAIERAHLDSRAASEEDFFRPFAATTEDRSNPIFIPRGQLNSESVVDAVLAAEPDVLAAYGCSIVTGRLLEAYRGRFLNAHLGLSPYYRGSGTNFWPLVNGEPEYMGVTFMHIDAGVDTGEIIHQIRPRIMANDMPHQIGNRLILDMALVYAEMMVRLPSLEAMPQPTEPVNGRVYRKKDFSEEATQKLYNNFEKGMIQRYLQTKRDRDQRVPIVINPKVPSVEDLHY